MRKWGLFLLYLTYFSEMWNIILIKDLIHDKGAFFDTVQVAMVVNSSIIHISTFKSYQFLSSATHGGFVVNVGVRLKLPLEL